MMLSCCRCRTGSTHECCAATMTPSASRGAPLQLQRPVDAPRRLLRPARGDDQALPPQQLAPHVLRPVGRDRRQQLRLHLCKTTQQSNVAAWTRVCMETTMLAGSAGTECNRCCMLLPCNTSHLDEALYVGALHAGRSAGHPVPVPHVLQLEPARLHVPGD